MQVGKKKKERRKEKEKGFPFTLSFLIRKSKEARKKKNYYPIGTSLS